MSWDTVTIGDSCDVIAGGTPKRSDARYWGGDIPWVKISDMLQGRITQTDESITQAGLDGSAAKLLPRGTLLVSIFATIGRTAVLECEASTNQAIVGVIPKQPDQFDDRFLEYALQEKTAELKRKARGVAQANINGAVLKATQIPLPPLAEQKRIAAILDAADALRAKRRESLKQLDTLLQSTFLEMFGDPVTNPMGWDPNPLGSAFELMHGFAFKSEHFVAEGQYVLLTPGNFFEEGGFRDRGKKQRYHDEPVPDAYVLEEGDLLIAMTEQAPGLLGSPILIPESQKFLHNQRLGKVVKKVEIDSLFIFALMNAASIRARIQKDSTGTKVKHTSPTKIAAIEIGIPPIPLQHRFAAIVESVEQQKAAHRDHLEELDTLFASLQQRAFNGELTGASTEHAELEGMLG